MPRVALIGGGIGGLAAALALRRRGIEPVVFEQSPQLKEVGAGIQITPNSTRILRALGLEEPVRNRGFEPGFMLTRDMASGEVLFRTQARGVMAERFGAGWFQIHRADLLDILTTALDGSDIRLNARCVAVEVTDKKGASVTLSDGRREDFDVVVGCDGIHSLVRATLHGREKPRFTGNMCWRALIPVEALPPGHLEPVMNYWMGPRGHVVAYYVRGGAMVNLVAVIESKDWVEESWSVEGRREELPAAFPRAHRDLRILLESVQRCFKWGLFDRDPLPRWGSGRITLLGDAAHPMLPFLSQGAAAGIEDAYVLARELARNSDTDAALASYENERRPRTARIQLAARAQGEIFHLHSPWARLKRSLRLDKFEKPRADLLSKDWIYDYDPTSA
ncbi:MAG TPA: FAD-dependent monooxygenase [Pseudolabrys sp.]|nr:FAD-dependent monooxygenase [Pseudolabrys sp.]